MSRIRLLFANIGWMTHYRGNCPNDQIVGGGSYRDDDKHEAFNYLPIGGKCYGYVQPVRWGKINLSRIDKTCSGERLDNVLVVWIAKHPVGGGTYIVGWYKNASVYSVFQESSSALRNNYEYNIVANSKDCTLIPIDQRSFQIPRANTKGLGFLGQSNVWYADSPNKDVQQFRDEAYHFIQEYSITERHISKQAIQVDAKARKQVEEAAILFVTKEYRKLGYRVVSREKENLGWDLDAQKNGITLMLEVKGLAQSQISVRISANEYKAMMVNKDSYRLCVVTNAIKKPTLIKFLWDKDVKAWVSETDSSIILSIELKPSYLAVVE